MDEKKLSKLRRLAFSKISKKRFISREEREDFAQDFIMRYLEGKSQKQDMGHAVIDYLRRTRPFSRVKGGRKPTDLDDFKKVELDPNLFVDNKGSVSNLSDRMDGLKRLNGLLREERILFILRYYFEFTFVELTLVFGLSENCLHKRMAEIERKLEKKNYIS